MLPDVLHFPLRSFRISQSNSGCRVSAEKVLLGIVKLGWRFVSVSAQHTAGSEDSPAPFFRFVKFFRELPFRSSYDDANLLSRQRTGCW